MNRTSICYRSFDFETDSSINDSLGCNLQSSPLLFSRCVIVGVMRVFQREKSLHHITYLHFY